MEFVNEKLEEFNTYLKNRRVAIIGLGVSNLPLIEYMHNVGAKVTVFDNKTIDKIPKEIMDTITAYAIEFSFGTDSLSKLINFDIIFSSSLILPT